MLFINYDVLLLSDLVTRISEVVSVSNERHVLVYRARSLGHEGKILDSVSGESGPPLHRTFFPRLA